MKSIREIEKNRVFYHQFKNRKSVHRSSLIAPKLKKCITNITFLNHFFIKRNYKNIALKISCIDNNGNFLDSCLIQVNKPKVYSLDLENFFEKKNKISQYLIEFFSHNNLYIPFPAVIVNHVGKDFVNCVHSFNRVLNDVFEEDLVNKHQVSEASLDTYVDKNYDTFFNFVSGINRVNSNLNLSYENNISKVKKTLPIKIQRMSNKNYFLSEIIPKNKIRQLNNFNNVIKILQPKQTLFYGRLLAGVINKKTGAFSANHTYYDSSNVKEYFKNKTSRRSYPYFQNCANKIRMYPIMSPSTILVHIKINSNNKIYKSEKKKLLSPGNYPIEFDIDKMVKNLQIKNPTNFEVVAEAKEKIPSRVNHQLVYGPKNSLSNLFSSINISLLNDGIKNPKNKKGLIWGQILLKKDYESRFGICFSKPGGEADNVSIEFYNTKGLAKKIKKKLKPDNSIVLNSNELKDLISEERFVWYTAKSNRPDMLAISFHWNKKSQNSSGEHNF